MKPRWIAINFVLVLALCGAGYFCYENYRIFMGTAQGGPKAVSHAGSSDNGPVDLPDAIQFRVKVDALCQEEAVLVEPGGPLKFTLRPRLDFPPDAPVKLSGWVASMPGLEEKISIDWKSEGGGELRSAGPGRYEFTPLPEGGDVLLRFRSEYTIPEGAPVRGKFGGGTSLHLVCPIPWDSLNAETQELIGNYPPPPSDPNLPKEKYRRPTHFYRVDESNEGLKISPHFRLGDFDLHFDYIESTSATAMNTFPQYVALNPRLVVKLEEILGGLQSKGIEVDTLGILAGFRSPSYNSWKRRQGGVGGKYTSPYSMHIYGNAADFYVDQDGDGKMDDLNSDGKIDQEDAAWVRENVVDRVDCQAEISNSGLVGACGIYGEHDIPNRPIQSPNLHVDTRSFQMIRWYINKRDEIANDWQYWTENTCAQILNATQ